MKIFVVTEAKTGKLVGCYSTLDFMCKHLQIANQFAKDSIHNNRSTSAVHPRTGRWMSVSIKHQTIK